MNPTKEQQVIVDHIQTTPGLTMVSAIAGSGKTAILSLIAKSIKPKSGLYLAYNKSVATEAQKKFIPAISSLTTHALAYRAVVIPNKLSIGFLSYKDLPRSLTYDNKIKLIEHIREFCLSDYLSFTKFAKDNDIKKTHSTIGNNILKDMANGKIECTHDFYLKYFHILLDNGTIKYDNFDIIMLDEAGDINAVTLEIFKLLPATHKVMVGDPFQNIYSFNHTINCFDAMKDKGTLYPMSQSFRVNKDIAKQIETFCQNNLDKNMQFKGVDTDEIITTRAYIARTNVSLIKKMLELNELGVQYGLTRTAKQIFNLPLILCNLTENGKILNPEFKHLQEDVDDYYRDEDIYENFKTPLSYIRNIYEDDISISIASNLIIKHGRNRIINCYDESRKHEKKNQLYMLGTSHSTKGLEFDEVTLADDLNKSTTDAVNAATKLRTKNKPLDTLSDEHKAELNLYYVACSRAKKKLHNALHIN